jgi:hypothetical protein
MKSLRIASAVLLLCAAAAACGGSDITAPGPRSVAPPAHDAGLGYLGGGGRYTRNCVSCTGAVADGQ